MAKKKLNKQQEILVKEMALGSVICDSSDIEIYKKLFSKSQRIASEAFKEITLWEPYEYYDLNETLDKIQEEENSLRYFAINILEKED